MKIPRTLHLPSLMWLSAASAALCYLFLQAGSGHVILQGEIPLAARLRFLAMVYLWPAFLAFFGLTLLQLQFRFSASGQRAGAVFGMSVIAALSLMQAIQAAASMPDAAPAYVVGMALSYTVLSRLYAVQMRRLWGRVPMPRVIWRGNRAAIAEFDRRMADMRAAHAHKPQE